MKKLSQLAFVSITLALGVGCVPKPPPHPIIVYVEVPAAAPEPEAFEPPAPPPRRRALWESPVNVGPTEQLAADPAEPRDPWPEENWRHRPRIVVEHDGTADITGHPDVTERRHLERAVDRCERRATRWARERCLEGAE